MNYSFFSPLKLELTINVNIIIHEWCFDATGSWSFWQFIWAQNFSQQISLIYRLITKISLVLSHNLIYTKHSRAKINLCIKYSIKLFKYRIKFVFTRVEYERPTRDRDSWMQTNPPIRIQCHTSKQMYSTFRKIDISVTRCWFILK